MPGRNRSSGSGVVAPQLVICRLVDTEPLGDFALQEAEVEAPFAEVISYRCKDLRVRTVLGTRAEVAWQKGNAGMRLRCPSVTILVEDGR